jgi:hypothetical protein
MLVRTSKEVEIKAVQLFPLDHWAVPSKINIVCGALFGLR